MVHKSKEIKVGAFSHAYEAGVSLKWTGRKIFFEVKGINWKGSISSLS